MYAWHQKVPLDTDTALNIFVANCGDFPPHWHEATEVIYIYSGKTIIGINDQIYELNDGDIMIVNSTDIHYFLNQTVSKRIILHYDAAFEPFASELLDQRFEKILLRKNPADESDSSTRNELERQIWQLLNEAQSQKPGYKIALKARLYDMLVTMLRSLPMQRFSYSSRIMRLKRLEHVFKFIEEHYTASISLEQAADCANFSVYHFSRFFKDSTGMTFVQYLNNYRVSKAAELLSRDTGTVTEIAARSGFESIKTFNRVFKQIKGCPPSTFRKAKPQ